MAANRNYSSVARATTLTSSVSGAATSIAVTETTGFPSVPFTLVLDPGRSGEEIVTITNVVGLALTAVRGQDGSGATPHDAGATVRHMATARDYREPAEHIGLTSAVHGVTANLVGTTDTQNLDNKTFSPLVTDHTPLTLKQASLQTAPIVVFKDSSNTTTGSIGVDGKVTTPGLVGTKASTLTAAVAGDTPLTLKGAASQSAHVLSMRNSSNTELLFIAPDGDLNAQDIVGTSLYTDGLMTSGSISTGNIGAAAITATGRVSTQGVDGLGTSVFTPATISNTALVSVALTGATASPFVVRDAASSTSQAGVSGETTGFRLYHGGSNTNYLPLRTHAGKVTSTIPNGSSDTSDTVSLSGMGFTQTPVITVSVQGPSSGQESRVAAVITAASTTSFTVRTIQTQVMNLDANQNYTIHWQAIQMTSSSASG